MPAPLSLSLSLVSPAIYLSLSHLPTTFFVFVLLLSLALKPLKSSAFFQAITALTTIEGNIFFNGPRAGINFNDGFGGGNVIRNNLLFNFCRETSDHGPFNSWDRQPYLTKGMSKHSEFFHGTTGYRVLCLLLSPFLTFLLLHPSSAFASHFFSSLLFSFCSCSSSSSSLRVQ